MGNKKTGISGIFQEIKNRKVHRAVIMYAAAAFIILQLFDIVTPALGLPQWVLTVVIILLAVGFPVVAILSWFFDLTPEGAIKTEVIGDDVESEAGVSKKRRKFRFSDGVMAVLLIVVCILLYPKIFKDKIDRLRDKEGKISLVVLPFENLSGDSLYNPWKNGFQNLVITGLSNSEELEVRQYQTINELIESDNQINTASMVPPLAGNVGKRLDSRTVVLGSFISAGKKIRINAKLIDSDSEEIYKTFQAEGGSQDDLFAMADTLSAMIRNYLEIEKYRKETDNPELQNYTNTKSPEAFLAYINGYDDFMSLEFLSAARWFHRSVQADPEFGQAYVMLSYTYHIMQDPELAKEWVAKAYEKMDKMQYKDKLMIDLVNSFYYETPREQISYVKQLIDLEEYNPFNWTVLGAVYFSLEDYENTVIADEKALEIYETWGTQYKNPFIYYVLGYSLHQTGDHKREKEVLEMGLSLYPDHQLIVQTQAICALSHNEIRKAEELIKRYVEIRETVTLCPSFRIEVGLGSIYAGASLIDEAEVHYRNAVALVPDEPEFINELSYFLIDKTDDEEKIREGLSLIDKALQNDPDNWLFLETKAWGLFKVGDKSGALKVMRQSWENRPAYNQAVYNHLQVIEKAAETKENL